MSPQKKSAKPWHSAEHCLNTNGLISKVLLDARTDETLASVEETVQRNAMKSKRLVE